MHYEWDPAKNEKNIRKHGISFSFAAHVFHDILRIEGYDEAHSWEEDRFYAIGEAKGRIIFVNFLEKSEGTIRIISARKATFKEKGNYYDQRQISGGDLS